MSEEQVLEMGRALYAWLEQHPNEVEAGACTAFREYLEAHPISVPDSIEAAIEIAVTRWLDTHPEVVSNALRKRRVQHT